MLGLSGLQSLFTGSTTRRSRRRRVEGGAQARSHPVCSQPTQATRDCVVLLSRASPLYARAAAGQAAGLEAGPPEPALAAAYPTAGVPGVKTCGHLCKRTRPRLRACVGVRAGSCAGNCAGACTGRTRALGRPNAGMAFRYWAWPATFHIGRRGAAALAHLLQRPVWPMQQPPSRAARRRCSARAWA